MMPRGQDEIELARRKRTGRHVRLPDIHATPGFAGHPTPGPVTLADPSQLSCGGGGGCSADSPKLISARGGRSAEAGNVSGAEKGRRPSFTINGDQPVELERP